MEAGEQVDPLDECFCGTQLLGLVGLLVVAGVLWFRGRGGVEGQRLPEVVERGWWWAQA